MGHLITWVCGTLLGRAIKSPIAKLAAGAQKDHKRPALFPYPAQDAGRHDQSRPCGGQLDERGGADELPGHGHGQAAVRPRLRVQFDGHRLPVEDEAVHQGMLSDISGKPQFKARSTDSDFDAFHGRFFSTHELP